MPSMPDDAILSALRAYIAEEVLEGHDVGLGTSTRLLELGVLNSMEIVRLTAFIENRFGVAVPAEMTLAKNFETLTAIAAMVSSLAKTDTQRAAASETG
jgi:acyl carrier protein